jgi:hypothetical protein
MDEETNTLIARIYFANSLYGNLTARDLSDWAISQIEQGFDSKNLCMLASMFNQQSYVELENYFNRSLKELDWDYPNKEECVTRYARLITGKIINREIEAFQGCIIMRDIYNTLDCPKTLSHWVSLYWSGDDLDFQGRVLTKKELSEMIIHEAKNYLSGETLVFPEKFQEKPLFEYSENKEGFLSKLWNKFF